MKTGTIGRSDAELMSLWWVCTDQFIFQLQNQVDCLHLRVHLNSLLQILQTNRHTDTNEDEWYPGVHDLRILSAEIDKRTVDVTFLYSINKYHNQNFGHTYDVVKNDGLFNNEQLQSD